MTGRAPVVHLDPEHVDELRRLLGTVEDWLLHASAEALDDLGGFLAGLSWSTAPPEPLAAALIADLGDHAVTLRRALTHPPRSADHSSADHSSADHSSGRSS